MGLEFPSRNPKKNSKILPKRLLVRPKWQKITQKAKPGGLFSGFFRGWPGKPHTELPGGCQAHGIEALRVIQQALAENAQLEWMLGQAFRYGFPSNSSTLGWFHHGFTMSLYASSMLALMFSNGVSFVGFVVISWWFWGWCVGPINVISWWVSGLELWGQLLLSEKFGRMNLRFFVRLLTNGSCLEIHVPHLSSHTHAFFKGFPKACTMGSAKAPVFPDPVSAKPMMSRPWRSLGVARMCCEDEKPFRPWLGASLCQAMIPPCNLSIGADSWATCLNVFGERGCFMCRVWFHDIFGMQFAGIPKSAQWPRPILSTLSVVGGFSRPNPFFRHWRVSPAKPKG